MHGLHVADARRPSRPRRTVPGSPAAATTLAATPTHARHCSLPRRPRARIYAFAARLHLAPRHGGHRATPPMDSRPPPLPAASVPSPARSSGNKSYPSQPCRRKNCMVSSPRRIARLRRRLTWCDASLCSNPNSSKAAACHRTDILMRGDSTGPAGPRRRTQGHLQRSSIAGGRRTVGSARRAQAGPAPAPVHCSSCRHSWMPSPH